MSKPESDTAGKLPAFGSIFCEKCNAFQQSACGAWCDRCVLNARARWGCDEMDVELEEHVANGR